MKLSLSLLSVLVAGIALIFSYISFRRSHRTSIQPILIFGNDICDDNNVTTWYVENVGNGPAMNVLLCGGVSMDGIDKDKAVIIPAMAKGAKERLNFLTKRSVLVATYCDVFGGKYTSTCTDSENAFFEKNLFPGIIPSRALYQIRMNGQQKDQT